MTSDGNKTCQRNCWVIAGCAGILLALLLVYLAKYPFGTAAFLGLLLFAVGGAFLSWAFCSGQPAAMAADQPVEVRRAPEPAPAPRAVSPEPPAPAAPPVAEAAAEPAAVMAAPMPMPAAKPAPKPRAAAKPAAPKAAKPAASPAKSARAKADKKEKADKPPRAAGLDAAITKTKDDTAPVAASPFLAAPRSSGPDDLKEIVGVGPVLEKLLNSIGVWHFDQIAGWKAKDIALVDSKMEGFKGRITRDEWVKQARVLAKGKKA